jgi:hypothetical protein
VGVRGHSSSPLAFRWRPRRDSFHFRFSGRVQRYMCTYVYISRCAGSFATKKSQISKSRVAIRVVASSCGDKKYYFEIENLHRRGNDQGISLGYLHGGLKAIRFHRPRSFSRFVVLEERNSTLVSSSTSGERTGIAFPHRGVGTRRSSPNYRKAPFFLKHVRAHAGAG